MGTALHGSDPSMRRPGQFAHPRTSVALSHQIHAARWAISRGPTSFPDRRRFITDSFPDISRAAW